MTDFECVSTYTYHSVPVNGRFYTKDPNRMLINLNQIISIRRWAAMPDETYYEIATTNPAGNRIIIGRADAERIMEIVGFSPQEEL